MKNLGTQQDFEVLMGRLPSTTPPPDLNVVYFTAAWCGACKRLSMSGIEAVFPDVNFLKCDVDANDYTPGFCGVRAIPAFVVVKKGKVVGPFQSSDNKEVTDWIKTNTS